MLTDDVLTNDAACAAGVLDEQSGLCGGDSPLRLELFSVEQRRERGLALGGEHRTGDGKGGGTVLLARLRDNEAALRKVHHELVDDVSHRRPVVPAAEWLVDNFYIIEEQVSLAFRHLPKKYLLELPRLTNSGKNGIPRVYDLAEHIVAYGDSRVDAADLSVVVSAYQEVRRLNLGELWAIPIMLRLALLENIRRMAAVMARDQADRTLAGRWADRLLRVAEEDPKGLVLELADMARSKPNLSNSFVAEFHRRLQGRGTAMKMPIQWVEQNLNERGDSIEKTLTRENHEQAMLEISMRNSVTSLRTLNVTDWNEFVETMSVVERILRRDPADVYGKMDFASRDRYRRAVEKLARRGDCEEAVVATASLDLARNAVVTHGARSSECHVGYYLIGPGEGELIDAVGCARSIGDRFRGMTARFRVALYLGSIFLLTAAITVALVLLARAGGAHGWMLAVLTVLFAFAASHPAAGLVNLAATWFVRPRFMARLDFQKDGIPAELRTLVVVPLIIAHESDVNDMLRSLEMQYLNNRGRNLHFALLTDFADSDNEHEPDDSRLLNLCRLGIIRLNDRYPEGGGDNFYLFHRPRQWNPAEGKWMGRERKRGKLEDLNRFLRGAEPDVFSCVEGRTETLANVRYVITLDADTAMPGNAAQKMIGAMAHPLNRPRFDVLPDGESGRRVVAGHAILQPRVDATIPGANRSWYAKMCAGEAGIDPYTFVSSDVYQDLFDEGSFVGKGIYDVEAFDRTLGGRFEDNEILSHDLLEGCVARSGLLADVKLYEDPPSAYLADVKRRHRWVRGDWQTAGVLLRGLFGGEKKNRVRLNALSVWKILDNLRRSLAPIALFLLLVLGFVVFRKPGFYILMAVAVVLGPVLVAGLWNLFRKSPDKTFRQHMRNSSKATLGQAAQALFKFACLPFEAYFNADAIVRSLWRQLVSRKLLLQWNPSDTRHKPELTHLDTVYRKMWISPAASAATAAVLAFTAPGVLPYALPILALWFFSPLVAGLMSRFRTPAVESLSERQKVFLRATARRTWSFFERFVNENENWLPPDNYQEDPVGRVAHRTSPTNIGLSLLANLSAHDFGYIETGRLLERIGNTLETMNRMERFRGHFYNWYDTRTLEVLRPAYVSTVDSGNLAAHCLVLASGLRGLAAAPVVNPNAFAGFLDTMRLAAEELGPKTPAGKEAAEAVKLIKEAADLSPEKPDVFVSTLAGIERKVAVLDEKYGVDAEQAGKSVWLRELAAQVKSLRNEIAEMMPWALSMSMNPDWSDYEPLRKIPTLYEAMDFSARLSAAAKTGIEPETRSVPRELTTLAGRSVEAAKRRLSTIQKLLGALESVADVDLDFLYNKSNRLLRIGFSAEDHRPDAGYYDLLASEARLACYLAIAQHKIPRESWFALARTLTLSGGRPLLISWSGSMFEYLMPLLVMPSYEGTLLDETYRACVQVQMDFAAEKGVPWGVSESGYYLFDADSNYQYRAFGVPELGLRHTMADELVIAPYASALATMVFPKRAAANLMRMDEFGYRGRYGFYEAVDYTPGHIERGRGHAIIKSYMAHHQGMALVALGQTLLGKPMHRRFVANPLLQSASLLLQEIVPAERAMYFHSSFSPEIHSKNEEAGPAIRVASNPDSSHPEVQLLSNGRYQVMITAAGSGYSRWNNLSVTRWREDMTRDNWGMFCYLRDHDSGAVWSNTHQPVKSRPESYEAVFSEGKAEFHRRDKNFDCRTEVVVAPDDDVEVRRLRITNRSDQERRLDVTSYAEIALAAPAADDSHPAFSKLFVQTRTVPDRQAIVCERRPRNREEKFPSVFHMLAVRGYTGGGVSYETDRLRFLGRGRDASNPAALDGTGGLLDGGVGAVLDPAVAIRTELVIAPGETAIVDMITGVAAEPSGVDALLEKYQDERSADKAFDLAWSHGQLLLRQLGITDNEAQRFCRLAASVVYVNPALRGETSALVRNRKGQSALWGYAISGDLPIVLLKVSDSSTIDFVDEIVQAHNYWRKKGLLADLVIWNADQSGYRQNLHDRIVGLAGAVIEDGNLERPGGIFIRALERIPEEDQILMESVARVVLSDADGMLDEQLRRLAKAGMVASSDLVQTRRMTALHDSDAPVETGELEFFNGYGGFSPDGREYVVISEKDMKPPLPWVNVLANSGFGSVVSESGSAYTWTENAHEFRLTPWSNDPVSDSGGEAVYLRDEESGVFWSPAPFPCRGKNRYVTRHGFGYSVFEHNAGGIHSRLTVHVDRDSGVKFSTLKIVNRTRRHRSLSVTAYVEWTLGELRAKNAPHIVTGIDSRSGALLARNHYNQDFRGRTAFLDVDDPGRSMTADRHEFLGRNGSPANPQGMRRSHLSGRVGAGMDPCGAVRVGFNLQPGQEREIVIRLGAAESLDEARKLIKQFRGVGAAKRSLAAVKDFWNEKLSAVRVETPDKAFNFMVNGWLPYQALACRFWGRSGLYQSGGAFGFRDQLQDSLALLYADPALVRKHLLDSAGRQFAEGDAQHWWHPPMGRGVRTRCSDDYLWLPFVAERYAAVTGDTGVFDETVRFVEGRPLNEGEESYYDLPRGSDEWGTLYEHCKRAINHGLRLGVHGLPLMGSGDWNDGMDLVGIGGRGESVWLGFFLHSVLTGFVDVAGKRGDSAFAERCRAEAAALAENIEKNAWDGAWYRRAYFDDGTPLGSSENDECRIDSLSQSWSVLSGAVDEKRAASGMRAVGKRLVDSEHMVVRLFEPAFDKSDLNPGYIKGYVPGVRENGGQYTHAATWVGLAYARLGDAANAWEVQRILNPVNHALTREQADVYKTEPYVIAADVYANPLHMGRGGWSWYTGSASWMYRFMLEGILGFNLTAGGLRVTPCVPADWNGFAIHFRRGQSMYEINVSKGAANGQTNAAASDDGTPIPTPDDNREHRLELHI